MRAKNLHPLPVVFFILVFFNFFIFKTNAQVCFTPAVGYASTTNPQALVSADVNGDGKIDLAVANYGSDNVSILLGNGTGGFTAATYFPVGDGPVAILSEDFNKDGKKDLALTNMLGNSVSILLGNGTGGFILDTTIAVGENPFSIIHADFNTDGKIDLAVGNYQSSNVSILMGDGLGGFTASAFASTFHLRALTSSDFNTDGKPDLAVVGVSGNFGSIYLGDGVGNFTANGTFPLHNPAYIILSSDFNGDGKADLSVPIDGYHLSILLGNGSGGFAPATDVIVDSAGYGYTSADMADFNLDGKLDFVLCHTITNSPGKISVSLGDGAGNFGKVTTFTVGLNAYAVAQGDFNGDGKSDLATANYDGHDVSILLNKPLVVTASASADKVCAGTIIRLSGGGASTYQWTGGVINGISFPAPSITTTYTVTGTDAECSSKATITITVNPLPTATLTKKNESSSLYCDGSLKAKLSAGSGPTQFKWTNASLTVLSTTDSIGALCPGVYTLQLVDTNACKNTYIDSILAGPVPSTPPICLVTLDPTLTHNVVVWEKTNLNMVPIDSFIVYREISTSNYQRIGAIHSDSLSTFNDLQADPTTTGYRYKLKSKNAKGVISPFSNYHNTIYLTNTSGNFNWTPYQIEGNITPVANYNIYRDNASTGSFILIGSTTGNQFGFTDPQFSSFPYSSYYVEAVMGAGACHPSRVDFSASRSNVKRFGTSGINDLNKQVMNVYPNPAENTFNITGITGRTKIFLYDVVGKIVMEKEADNNTTLNVSQLEEGAFILITENKAGRTYTKVMIRH